ncbi:hypothetical protein DL95DRAFT_468880 [Leptodontidium sp. 2 PMI_412]|nr:hypothetical protein DL95DRAFT_468880 [Leptodontidium sp. 2 PMI_412]
MTTGDDSQAASVIASATIAVGLATFVVILRFITRTKILHFVGKDDWCIGIALVFSFGNSVAMIIQAKYALGQHFRTLNRPQITGFLQSFYFSILFYALSFNFTKISILMLYIRMFNASRTRYSCYVLLGVVIAFGTLAFFSSVLPCLPVARFWDEEITGHCLPTLPIWFTNSSLNIVTDLTIFILPLHPISQLNLPKTQKIFLLFVFALGFLVCLISILRLHSLKVASTSTDPTWDNVGIANWSNIELNTAIICPCLTTLRPLISRLLPRLRASRSTTVHDQFNVGRDVASNGSTGMTGMETFGEHGTGIDSQSDRILV